MDDLTTSETVELRREGARDRIEFVNFLRVIQYYFYRFHVQLNGKLNVLSVVYHISISLFLLSFVIYMLNAKSPSMKRSKED